MSEDKLNNEEVEETEQDTQPETDEGTKTDEKTFTQEELDAIVEKRIAREKAKQDELKKQAELEKKQAEELAKLSAEERAKKEFEFEQEEFKKQQQEFYRERLELQTTKELDERDLPVSFAKYVIGEDAESTQERINEFEGLWEKELERRRVDAMRGKTPTTGIQSPAVTQEEFDEMDYTDKVEIYNNNPELYKQLTK